MGGTHGGPRGADIRVGRCNGSAGWGTARGLSARARRVDKAIALGMVGPLSTSKRRQIRVGLASASLRLVGEEVGDCEGREHTDQGDGDHQLDQREAAASNRARRR